MLFGVPDIELLGLLKAMCNVLDQQQVGRKFDLQTRETYVTPKSRENTIYNSNSGASSNCINMPDYFRSSTNRKVEASSILTQKIHIDFTDVFTGIDCFKGMYELQVREDSCL